VTTFPPSLAQRLRAHRAAMGISQAQAARELQVARTAYRLWELEAARPAADRWRGLADWLGISITTLLAAEGLMAEDEGQRQGDFFLQAETVIDRGLREGIVNTAEAKQFREISNRIQRGLPGARLP
jgi:transcriptional regulator with XRE-family HTH domain